MDDKGTYITKDNGHANQRKQIYTHVGVLKRPVPSSPGPGSYETNMSLVGSDFSKKFQSKRNLNNSVTHQQSLQPATSSFLSTAATNRLPGMGKQKRKNFAIPSIPSRFMTPILQFDQSDKVSNLLEGQYEVLDGQIDNSLVSKVARLTNDGHQVGPGQYNVDSSSKMVQHSPRGVTRWNYSKSER